MGGVLCEKRRVLFSPSMQQWLIGNTALHPLWSKKDVRCLKIVVRSKETLTVASSVVWHWEWLHVARLHVAVRRAARTLPWIGTDDSVEEQRLQAEQNSKMQQIQDFQVGGSEKHIGITTRDMSCRKTEAQQTNGTLTMATFCITQHQSCLSSTPSTQPTLKLEQSEPHRKVIYYLPNLDAGPPEWRDNGVCSLASVTTAAHGSITLGVAVGPRHYTADQLLAKSDVSTAIHGRVQLCRDPQTEF